MTFAQLSAIYEPYNHTRKIIGFDTFEGFPKISDKDITEKVTHKPGELATYPGIEDEILEAIRIFDKNRPLSHISKVEIVKGDATQTIPDYIQKNPHTVVSLLYLDIDLYEPTKVALETFVPRIPKGGVIAFDELNCPNYPGETLALLETLGINNIELRRAEPDPWISYAVL